MIGCAPPSACLCFTRIAAIFGWDEVGNVIAVVAVPVRKNASVEHQLNWFVTLMSRRTLSTLAQTAAAL
jgi:hypothetical protein